MQYTEGQYLTVKCLFVALAVCGKPLIVYSRLAAVCGNAVTFLSSRVLALVRGP